MKRKGMRFFNLLFFLLIIVGLSACRNGNEVDVEVIPFSYQQGKENDFKSYMYYNDDYFKNSSTEYNPSLATASLCLAMSSFASNENENYNDYSCRYRNAYSLMENIGLTDISVNEWYTKKPTTDSIGLIFGNKKIFGKTLIVVGIRGANYESEWSSNCTLGNGESPIHKGFYDSASIYIEDLKEYIEANGISGDIILWTSGYSRASAVNNLACARIDQAIYKNEKILGNNVSIKKEDLYSYCFEVPMGASFLEDINPRSEIYNNIFNIVNYNDVVTKVAPSYMGFTRYGVDHYLPMSNLDENYSEDLKEILSFYNKMDNIDALGDYKISSFKVYSLSMSGSYGLGQDSNKVNWTLGLFLEEFVNYLAQYGMIDFDNYYNNIETGIRNIFSLVYGGVPPKYTIETVLISFVRNILINMDVEYLITDLLHNPAEFPKDIMPYIIMSIDSLELDIDVIELANGLYGLLVALANTFKENINLLFSFLNVENIKAVASAHYPELCLAHMMAQDPNYSKNPISYDSTGSYYKLVIPYASDISIVVKSNNDVLVEVKDGDIINRSYLAYGKVLGDFVAYLPTDKEYQIEVINSNEKPSVYKFLQDKPDLVSISLKNTGNIYYI